MRHLSTLALGGLLGVFLMAGDAEACHKNRCGATCAQPVACVQPAPVACARPAPVACARRPAPVACARPVKTCAPRAKKCGGLFHNKSKCSTCAAPVVACNYAPTYGYQAPMATGQAYPTPQATGQPWTTPAVPSKR